jgi:hypothetical protein
MQRRYINGFGRQKLLERGNILSDKGIFESESQAI